MITTNLFFIFFCFRTCTSLRLPSRKETAQVTNNLPSPSCSNSSFNDNDLENRPPSTSSPVSEFSTATLSSRSSYLIYRYYIIYITDVNMRIL